MKKFFTFLLVTIIAFGAPLSVSANAREIYNVPEFRSVTQTLRYPVISREDWGCPDNDPESPYYCNGPFWFAYRNPISHIIIHHTATGTESENWEEDMRYVWTLHSTIRDDNPNDGVQGWTDVGYNYVIDHDGNVYEGRYGGEGATGGHVGGHNVGTVGISLLGNYDEMTLGDEQYESLKELLTTLFIKYKIDPMEFAYDYGGGFSQRLSVHNHWSNTACPGRNVTPVIDQLREEISEEVRRTWKRELQPSVCPGSLVEGEEGCYEINTRTEYGPNLQSINNIAVASNGDMFVSSYYNSYLRKIDEHGNEEILDTDFITRDIARYSVDLELDEELNRLYILNANKKQLFGLNLDTLELELTVDTEEAPNDMTVLSDGTIYIVNADSDSLTKVSSDGETEVIELDGEYPIRIIHDSRDNIFISMYFSDFVTKIKPGGKTDHFKTGGILPIGMFVDEEDNVFIVNEGDGSVSVIDNNENINKAYDLPYQANAITKDSEGDLWVTHPYNSAISKIDRDGLISTVKDIGNEPIDIMNINNELLVLDNNETGFIRVSLAGDPAIPLTSPIYRFWSDNKKTHFYTASKEEKDYVIADYDDSDWYFERPEFYAVSEETEDTVPVYRFWSDEQQAHFYTVDEVEKDWINETYEENVWKYEGIAYYAYKDEEDDTVPVYRFWSEGKKAHFYTIDEDEKEWIEDTFSEDVWEYEGIAFYVFE